MKFPKLTNIEENVKFKEAINHLYAEADLSKYYKTNHKKRSVAEILATHKPENVIKKYNEQKTMLKS